MGLWDTLRDSFRDPNAGRDRDHHRRQREDRRHHEREAWREEGRRDPYAPPEERDHPNDPDRGHGGGGW